MTQPAEPVQLPKTPDELLARIVKESELEPEDLAALRRTVSMPGGWEADRPCPLFPQTHVVSFLFAGASGERDDDHMAGDVRVYVAPHQLTPEAEFFRFTINRSPGSAIKREAFLMPAFIDDVAYELRQSVVEVDDEEDEADTCPACKEEVDGKYCSACGHPVRRCSDPECLRVAEPRDNFCGSCGLPLPQAK